MTQRRYPPSNLELSCEHGTGSDARALYQMHNIEGLARCHKYLQPSFKARDLVKGSPDSRACDASEHEANGGVCNHNIPWLDSETQYI